VRSLKVARGWDEAKGVGGHVPESLCASIRVDIRNNLPCLFHFHRTACAGLRRSAFIAGRIGAPH
jgi:hypothetical protein